MLVSRFGEYELMSLEKGKEYIFFIAYNDNTGKLYKPYPTNYFFAHVWQGIILINGDEYLFDDAFASLKNSDKKKVVKVQGDDKQFCVYKGKDFEEKLQELIDKKVKK